MYRLREFRDSDWEALRELHARNGYKFPLPKRLTEARVVEDEETGKIVEIIATRETRECFSWLDHSWATPGWRWDAFVVAHNEIHDELRAKGIEDVKLWTEGRGFGRRLVRKLGWIKHIIPSFTHDI